MGIICFSSLMVKNHVFHARIPFYPVHLKWFMCKFEVPPANVKIITLNALHIQDVGPSKYDIERPHTNITKL